MPRWSTALMVAPFAMSVVACSSDGSSPNGGGRDATPAGNRDAGPQGARDAGRQGDPDAGGQPGADAGAANDDASVTGDPDAGNPNCSYPPGAVEPMALNEVLFPYSWPVAIDGPGNRFDLDLEQAHCNTDPDMDWSPHDILLFVSIPAF